jgi:hypothetical protein
MHGSLLATLAVCALVTACGGGVETASVSTQVTDSPSHLPGGSFSAPGPEHAPSKPGQQVILLHCGVQNVQYDGAEWEVENAPFDAGSAPDSTFSGFGTFNRDGEVVTFTDREGAVLRFTRWDGTPDPYNCA